MADGSVMVKTELIEQLLASVATTVYVPAVVAYGLLCVDPFTLYVIKPVPPVALNVNEPLAPLHNALLELLVILSADGCVNVIVVDALQLFTSAATMVYVPTPTLKILDDCGAPPFNV